MTAYRASGASDVGLRRANNEDAFLVCADRGVFAVADGMGGAAAGEVASAIFIEAAGELLGAGAPPTAEKAASLVREAFRLANARLIGHVAARPEHQGMGCTAELLVFSGDRYLLGHVGDSRTYLLRERELRQITRDHSLVQQMVDRGQILAVEARHHSRKNVVLRALGADLELSFDLVRGTLFPKDLFLLCSDGLTDMLDDDSIRKTLLLQVSLSEKVGMLIDEAKAAGGRDNVTVVLCQVERTQCQAC
jgi:PPM family protein phosphatase